MKTTDTRTAVYLPAEVKRAVHQAAEAMRISESAWIRQAITQQLGRLERREGK